MKRQMSLFVLSGLILTLQFPVCVSSQVLINEIMSSNTLTIQDENGDSPDWIELYNSGNESVDLAGYGLSDRPDNPYKWVIPNYTLESKQHLLIFSSDQDVNNSAAHWETVITKGDDWNYYYYEEVGPPDDWNTHDFDDSEWQTGPSSFGTTSVLDHYDRDNLPREFDTPKKMIIRKSFTIENVSDIVHGLLQIDYSDAFVAYLNGQEIARANIGEPGVPVTFDTLPDEEHWSAFGRNYGEDNPIFPDVEVFNLQNIETLLQPGENILAVQMHGFELNSTYLLPYLTLGMNRIPPEPRGVPDVLKFSLTNPHFNFKLSADGETLVLTDPDGDLCDSVNTKIVGSDISRGRKPDGAEEWVEFLKPTPGKRNNTFGYEGNTEVVVEMSLPGGFYESTVMVELSTDAENAKIRYTIDGADPTLRSPLYSSALSINATTVVRSRVFEDNLLPGPISTLTYFINDKKTLPVVSLSTNPDNLFDDETGIYAKANYMEDWERPAHIELFEPDGSPGFCMDAGIKISGFLIRNYAQKSFALFARPKYGDGSFKYQLFPDSELTEFESFRLRNGGNEWPNTRFGDGLCHILLKDSGLDVASFRPAVVYLNGDYWGLYNLREKQNEDYLASHHDIDPDKVDILEYFSGLQVIEGDSLHYKEMLSYVKNNDMNKADCFDYIKTQMDVDNYIDYNVAQLYLHNKNWLHHNTKFWRPRSSDGKWRWLLADLDDSMHLSIIDTNYLQDIRDGDYEYNALFNKLLENDTFRKDLINRFADYMNTVFKPNNVMPQLYGFKAIIEAEIPSHITRWDVSDAHVIEKIESKTQWEKNVDNKATFFTRKPNIMRNHIIEVFNLSGTSNLTLASSSTGGKIKLNSLSLDTFPWSGTYFSNVPITITARPDLGYQFVRWEGASSSSEASIELTLTADTELSAVFVKTGNDIVINISQSPFEVTGDLVISPEMSLTVEAGVELLMADDVSIIVQGLLNIEGSADEPVVIHSANSSRWGAIVFDNAVGESTLLHALIRDASHGSDALLYPAAASGVNSDFTMENVSFEENIQGIFSTGGNVTVRDCVFDSSNSDEPINIKDGWALVEGCCFYDVQEQDAIDFDGVSGGIIKGNQIYGSNDDGIDIGDGCTNILIVGNRISSCFDKAISIGEVSTEIRVERNILSTSGYGIAVKDNSTATIDHCTFFGNEFAIAGYEKGEDSSGGGTAIVTNSILAGSMISVLMTDNLSAITISYSLSDSELLPGDGNIQGDAAMMAPDYGGFMLTDGSPAIDSGDPGSEFDSDGSRPDMGALAYHSDKAPVIITEINYNSSSDFDSGDWLELFNGSGSTVDLSGWRFSDGDDANLFSMPDGATLDAGAYLVLYRDNTKFTGLFPQVSNAVGDFDFALSNGGEALRLFDSESVLQDIVVYDDEAPWPAGSDGSGATLALKSPDLDNSFAENWGYSSGYGTPGAANAGDVGVEDVAPVAYSLGQNYPNPFNPTTAIPFTLSADSHVSLAIYSVLGQRVITLVDERVSAGNHHVTFDADGLSSGIYIYRIEAGQWRETESMLLVK